MRFFLVRAVFVSLLAILLLAHASNAEETNFASATPVSPSDCTFAPQPVDELRELTIAGWPQVRARLQGTPISPPMTSAQQEQAVPESDPADVETFNAAQEIVRQIAACTNAGDRGALISLYDDEGAAAYLAVGLFSFSQGAASEDVTIDPLLLDTYLASLQLSAPLPDEDRVSAYLVDSVTVQDDGLIYVVASLARGEDELAPFAFYLREEDGQYRIVFDVTADSTPKSIPIATPQH